MTVTPSFGTDLSRRSFGRILLVKPSSLGDVVHALPVLHGLRHRYPDATIDWLIASQFAPLLEGLEELDELVAFDRRKFSRLGTSPKATGAFVKFVQRLRRRRYDLVIDLQGLFRTGFLTRATGAPVRIGFREAREGAWVFYTHCLPRADENIHAVDRNYGVARLLGFEDVPVRFPLDLPETKHEQVRALLGDAGWDGCGRLVLVAPGARWETKIWLLDRFAAVVDELHSDVDTQCVLVGGPDEALLCSQIADECCSSPINLAGRTDVLHFAALVALADVVLGHDSAAMHLAVALKRPLVCLTGPTNPRRTGPYGRLHDVLQATLDCSPCYLRRLSQCNYAHACMQQLQAADVVDAVRRSLVVEPACNLR